MRVRDEQTAEVFVMRNPEGGSVELQIGKAGEEGVRVVHLTGEEARRLAALILFQAARLDRPRADWRLPYVNAGRESA